MKLKTPQREPEISLPFEKKCGFGLGNLFFLTNTRLARNFELRKSTNSVLIKMPSTMNIYIYMNKMPSDIWAQNKLKVIDLLAEQKMDSRTGKPTGQNQ